jgi:rfaE bifunctional protein kinase chain/domain
MSKHNDTFQIQTISHDKNYILSKVNQLKNKKVLLVGDICLDEYFMGEVRRISPEAPVPVLEVQEEDYRLGMAGNVALNIQSLGGVPQLLSVIGQDHGAEKLLKIFSQQNLSSDFLITDSSRPTTRKTRIMAKHHHLCRVDFETRKMISSETSEKIESLFKNKIVNCDVVVVEDYAKGLLSPKLIQELIRISHQAGKKVLIDPHVTHHAEYYKGADLIKPNLNESLALIGRSEWYVDTSDQKSLAEVLDLLHQKTQSESVVMTLGKEGMIISEQSQTTSRQSMVPTFARDVFDVTGAGDTVIAAISLALASNISLQESCVLANYAAGYVVGQVGCVPCRVEDIKQYILNS